MKAKKPTKRSRDKFAALKPQFNLKSRQDLIDYDYLDKLTDKVKAWLNAFTEEYVGANMNHKGKKLHKTQALKKDCYNRNNARNRDVLTRAKASGKFHYMDDVFSSEQALNEHLKETLGLDEGEE